MLHQYRREDRQELGSVESGDENNNNWQNMESFDPANFYRQLPKGG